MSFLGNLLGTNSPDERFVDDQAAQDDYRDNEYVGHIIDQACSVYDAMFSALEYTLKGRANVLSQMDKTIERLEKQCDSLVKKYEEILAKLKEASAGLEIDLSIDIAKDALAILNANPVLRRYVGEANYWMLWDMLAVLSGQGMTAGADISSNIKDAIKGTIYAMLSMTNGLMHFESYIGQVTQFWGWLYMKEIPLSLVDSVCPQVTCQYYYMKPLPGNPAPGPAAYAPMPFPIFNQTDYSWEYIVTHFSYDDRSTWNVLTPESRRAMEKAYSYWMSNYTNAVSANDLLSGATSKLTGGAFTVGFGQRHGDYPGGSPLKIGSTFNQLDTSVNESFPVRVLEDDLAAAYMDVDETFLALVSAMEDPEITAKRDARLNAAGFPEYAGTWHYIMGSGALGADAIENAAIEICVDVVTELPEAAEYATAIEKLSRKYREANAEDYSIPYGGGLSALSSYLVRTYKELAGNLSLSTLSDYIEGAEGNPYVFNPYQAYSADAEVAVLYAYAAQYMEYAKDSAPFYSGVGNNLSFTVDADGELGLKIAGGREPLFAALGIYGDLKGLYSWNYEIVPLDAFRERYTKIDNAYHIYYRNDDPSVVVFADRTFQAGALKYIATCRHVATDEISRGTGQNAERFIAYIFPGETCSVYEVPDPGVMLGQEFPSFSTLQRVDATSDTGQKYMYDLIRNQIPRYPKYVDAGKWSVMDLIHELWLLADALTPICGDGGERKAKLDELLNGNSLHVRNGTSDGPMFIGQLPGTAGQGDLPGEGRHVELEFAAMSDFAGRIRNAINAVYDARDAVLQATQAW